MSAARVLEDLAFTPDEPVPGECAITQRGTWWTLVLRLSARPLCTCAGRRQIFTVGRDVDLLRSRMRTWRVVRRVDGRVLARITGVPNPPPWVAAEIGPRETLKFTRTEPALGECQLSNEDGYATLRISLREFLGEARLLRVGLECTLSRDRSPGAGAGSWEVRDGAGKAVLYRLAGVPEPPPW